MSLGTPVLSPPTHGHRSAIGSGGVLALFLLSAGHFSIDLYATALGALQPILVTNLHLSLAQAGLLGGVMILFNAVMQPLYGYLSDRYETRAFTTLAPAITAIFVCLLGLAPSFGALLGFVIIAGSATAAFHPQGAALAASTTTGRPGRAMSIFVTAGTLGMALSPVCFTAAISYFGLRYLGWAAVPGVLTSVALVWLFPKRAIRASGGLKRGVDWSELKAVKRPLLVLYGLVFLRSVLQVTFGQFLPLYLSRERGLSFSQANLLLSAYLGCGALGGFLGGHLADRFGGRRITMVSMIGCVPPLVLFYFGSGWMAWTGLALGGLVLLFTIPVNVVMAQQLVPRQAGTISALFMGFAWGMAGLIFVPVTGWIGDQAGLDFALKLLLIAPVLGFALTFWLKPERPGTVEVPA